MYSLAKDEGCRSPGINQITKHKSKASESGEKEGRDRNTKDTTVENRQFDWGAQMHLSCTTEQSSSGKKQKKQKMIKKRGQGRSVFFFFFFSSETAAASGDMVGCSK